MNIGLTSAALISMQGNEWANLGLLISFIIVGIVFLIIYLRDKFRR